jgi:hypothetical protein
MRWIQYSTYGIPPDSATLLQGRGDFFGCENLSEAALSVRGYLAAVLPGVAAAFVSHQSGF